MLLHSDNKSQVGGLPISLLLINCGYMKTLQNAFAPKKAFGLSQLLIVIAVFMRVIIPQGFMLGETAQIGENKSVSIILCTAQGDLPAMMDEKGDIILADAESGDNSTHENGQGNANSHCIFAGALADATSDFANFDYVKTNWAFNFSNIEHVQIEIGNGLAAPPPPKTGPPILV